jgi:hypothetical protein
MPTETTGSCHAMICRVCWASSDSPTAVFPISVPVENVPIGKYDSSSDVAGTGGSLPPCTDMNVSRRLDVPCTVGDGAYVGAETVDSSGSDEWKRWWPVGGSLGGAS